MPSPAPTRAAAAAPDSSQVLEALRRNIESVLYGKPEVVERALVTLLAGGHLLVEDVPGVGKTLLARALGASIDATVRRVQFTPDLLPSDVTGIDVFTPETGTFEFRPGPVFSNIVLADEINRAGPKTQSALLEAMEEGTVTVDGTTRTLPAPFMVIATQNPIELDGTYPLPEAQRDRFLVRTDLGYPDRNAEFAMLRTHAATDLVPTLSPVTTAADVAAIIAGVARLHLADPVANYVLDLVEATRTHPQLVLGASPRAGLSLVRAGRARAALHGRDHVLPDDVKAMAVSVLSHRVQLAASAHADDLTPNDVISGLVETTPAPVG